MVGAALMAAASLLAGSQDLVPAPPMVVAAQDPTEARVDDVVVEGRRLEDAASDFVAEVAAPVGNRGLARWNRGVCVGVHNLQGDVAQYVVDRVSTVAADLGLLIGEPGCRPNILIAATDDGAELARSLVDGKMRAFHTGSAGTNQTRAVLRDFQESDRPVRWWQLSIPIDSVTGSPAVALRGDVSNPSGDGDSVLNYAPNIKTFSASRVSTQIRDDIMSSLVIVDVDQVDGIDVRQLADFAAMVSLAQIDPDGDTSRYNTILNVFDPAIGREAGLTAWDVAYLEGLYQAEQNRKQRGVQVQRVSSVLADRRRAASLTDQD